MEADGVDRVDLVGEVEVGVEAVHHHHHLVGFRAALLRVDDEGAVEAAGDVGGERRDVAVVEVEAEGLGVELVGEALAGLDLAAALRSPIPGMPSICAGWMPWKCIVCGCSEALTKRIRSFSPSRARRVGPGTRPL